jgi:Arc/MetJ-type ribon-helix-helix transcriptional regulator
MSRPIKHVNGSKIISITLDQEIAAVLDDKRYPFNRSEYINRLIRRDLERRGLM